MTTKTTPTMKARSFDSQFWLLSLALVAFWGVVFATAAPPTNVATAVGGSGATTTTDDQELRNARNCKALCEHCGGLGFYCGEECICECNDDSSDTECIATMQSNARKLDIPFEILIQGPSANRFVRNAHQFEQNAPLKSIGPPRPKEVRNKRSTVVIYKPASQNSLYGQCDQKLAPGAKVTTAQKRSIESQSPPSSSSSSTRPKSIKKRSVDQMDWFTDFANTLVRPAPLRPQKKAVPVEEPVQRKRSTPELDRSWFTDNTKLLLRPAPIHKRQSSESERSYDGPMKAIGQLPQVLKDTISSADALRSRIREGAEAFQSQLAENSLDIFSETMRDNFQETMANMRPSMVRTDMAVPTMAPVTVPPSMSLPRVSIPWFRPMRFLQRVQQAIN